MTEVWSVRKENENEKGAGIVSYFCPPWLGDGVVGIVSE
jgi:hypothetical protein